MSGVILNSSIIWVSEAAQLPPIAQPVFVAQPRQFEEFWDISVGRILVQYDGVIPLPVKPGNQWPTTYYWDLSGSRARGPMHLVSGNGWWASMDGIALPPGAEHVVDKFRPEFRYVKQPNPVFIGRSAQRG